MEAHASLCISCLCTCMHARVCVSTLCDVRLTDHLAIKGFALPVQQHSNFEIDHEIFSIYYTYSHSFLFKGQLDHRNDFLTSPFNWANLDGDQLSNKFNNNVSSPRPHTPVRY